MQVDVLCVGHASYDLVFLVQDEPQPNQKTKAEGFLQCGGGPAANAAVAVARLGGSAAFAGYLGEDRHGDKHLLELGRDGVVTDLVVRGAAPTPISVVLVKPDGQRFLVNYREDTEPLPAGSVDFSSISASVVLFDGHEPEISPALATAAKQEGATIMLDAGSLHSGTESLIDQVDYLVCSEDFAKQFTGKDSHDAALGDLYRHAPNVVITLGDKGLVWMTRQGSGLLPAYPVAAFDTTGAGDAFHGAFAACIARQLDWDETLRTASAAAALSCTRLGARPGIPRSPELKDFLAEEGALG
jgi:sulfofructose kinase